MHVLAPPHACHSPQLYSPRLLIVRQLKSDTAKTVPAVPAAPALGFAHTVGSDWVGLLLSYKYIKF